MVILLGEYWWQKYSSKLVIARWFVAKLSLSVGSGDLIMVGRGSLWLGEVK